MKCIDDELIQKYIYGETDARETDRIEKHLADCSRCVQNIEEQRAFAGAVKRDIGSMCKQAVAIPGFVAPTARKYRLNAKIRYCIYAVSAACAVFLIVFLRNAQNAETQQSIQMIYSFDGDFNSNKTVSQQEMAIIMIDADGNIVEYN